MATPGSAESQLVECNTAVSEFYTALSDQLHSSGASIDFTDYYSRLVYDELLRRSQQDANGTADPMCGVAVDEVHGVSSLLREYSMGIETKASIYNAIATDYQSTAEYYSDRAVLNASILRGDNRVAYLP
jgi:hypothetical protein